MTTLTPSRRLPPDRMGSRVAAVMARRSPPVRWYAAVLLGLTACIAAVTLVDRSSGPGLNLAILYVIPPLAAALVLGMTPAVVLAAAAAVGWVVGEPAPADLGSPWLHAVDAGIRFLGVSMVAILLDALRRTMARAIDSDQRARDFLGLAAHQMRTPVAALRAAAETLVSMGGTEEQEPFLLDMAVEAARIGRLVNNLLHLARLDEGTAYPVRKADPVMVCEEEVARAERRSVGISVELEAEPIGVIEICDDVLRETVANLLDNACRHAVSQIEVCMAQRRKALVLTVRDDGPGLPRGAERDAFRRFVSFDGGAGLGLPLCRDAARRMGGDLTYRDGAFELRLPVAIP